MSGSKTHQQEACLLTQGHTHGFSMFTHDCSAEYNTQITMPVCSLTTGWLWPLLIMMWKVLALLLCTLLCIPVHGYGETIKANTRTINFRTTKRSGLIRKRFCWCSNFHSYIWDSNQKLFSQNQSLIYQYNVTYSVLIIIKKKIRLFIHLNFVRQPKQQGHPLTSTNVRAAALNCGTEVKAAAGDLMRLTL